MWYIWALGITAVVYVLLQRIENERATKRGEVPSIMRKIGLGFFIGLIAIVLCYMVHTSGEMKGGENVATDVHWTDVIKEEIQTGLPPF